ncbi:MAG TPA: hypothetical protein VFN56_03280 [Candidatus Saccharimonadales bacterium]|nr:hypothetical protein [Candidatus Saccharimonadales bacterium]
MDHTYWHKQTSNNPIFPDLVWSRPENRAHAGKLLIVGGNLHGFSAVATAFSEADKAGIGTARALLPSSLQKTVGRIFEAGEYAPSTPSGSFAQTALSEMLAMAAWSDGVLLAGDFGRNSETAIVLEKFAAKYSGQLTLTKDAADYFTPSPKALLQRPATTFVISFSQLQQLGMHAQFISPFTYNMDLLRLLDALHEFTTIYPVSIIVKHLQNIVVATSGKVSTTKLEADLEMWRVATAAHAAVWWLQNPSKTFEALTTSVA